MKVNRVGAKHGPDSCAGVQVHSGAGGARTALCYPGAGQNGDPPLRDLPEIRGRIKKVSSPFNWMTPIKATEVFTPGAFPAHTYIARDGEALERALKDALDTPGQIVSLVGPSKSGKTVLVEKVVGLDNIVTITGAGIRAAEEIWSRVCDSLGLPNSQGASESKTKKLGAELEVSGGVSAFGLAKAQGKSKGSFGSDTQDASSATIHRRGLEDVVAQIGKTDRAVLVDDFHYMPRDVQAEAAKSLKEAVRRGVRVVTAAVLHRGDDLVRANPELRGRVRSIDLVYWSESDLRAIGVEGFALLNVELDEASLNALVREAAGSPQLMQLLCLTACFVLDLRVSRSRKEELSVSAHQLQIIFEQTSASTEFRSLVDVLDSGPKTRGTERKIYKFRDGSQGDVYRAVLKAVASDPPMLSFDYEELGRRANTVCDGDAPVGSSMVGTCLHISRLAAEKFPNERAIDWDEQKQILDIPDPYLLFYLRWSGRLSEAE